ncbi:MAG: hypothetical protein R8L58_02055 [Mariprofundaceae bacterium]
MRGLVEMIRRTGVWQSTALLVALVVIISIGLDIVVHAMLGEPMLEPFILADTLIATLIATPISYTLLYMLIKLHNQREALLKAAEDIKTLEGLLPVCAGCKKIRDDKGNWYSVDIYIRQHTRAEITHGLCPDCAVTTMSSIPEMESSDTR